MPAVHEIEPLWTKQEVRDYLNVSIFTVEKWVTARTIPHLRFNGTIRFDPSVVRAWANGQESVPTPAAPKLNRATQMFRARVGT